MKHWVPDEAAAALRPAKRHQQRQQQRARRQRLSAGSKAGLALVALGCAGIVLGVYSAFGRADVFAEDAGQLP